MKKLLCIAISLFMMLSIASVSIHAAEILMTFDASVAGGVAEEAKSGGKVDLNEYNGDAWGFYSDRETDGMTMQASTVYKMAFLFTLGDMDGVTGELKFAISNNFQNSSVEALFEDCSEGDKVIIVCVFKSAADAGRVEGKIWNQNRYDMTFDKVVISDATYDFGNYGSGYKVIAETGDEVLSHAGDENLKISDEDTFTPSTKGTVGGGEDNTPADPKPADPQKPGTTNPKTGDASVIFAVVAAGAAAFGGLQLKRKSK